VSNTTLWVVILITSAGAFAFKLLGQSLPQQLLERPRTERLAFLIPIALLAALTAVLTFVGEDRTLVLDARAAGVAAAVVLLLLRAPFLVVVAGAAVTAAVLRGIFG
jgi:hypothetical protein